MPSLIPLGMNLNRIAPPNYANGRGRIKLPIEPVGQSAILIVRPKVPFCSTTTALRHKYVCKPLVVHGSFIQ